MTRLQAFFLALLSSLLLLAATHVFSLPPLAALLGLIPLAAYHSFLWSAESLTQQEIDSVYYFGFLLTLATLGLSAFNLAESGDASNDISSIGTQFALGLLATGYGLIARISLQSKRLSLDNVDEAFDKQLDQVSRLVREFGNTIELFRDLKEEAVKGVVQGATGASAEIVRLISRDLEAPVNSLQGALARLDTAVSLVSPEKFQGISESALALKKSLRDLSQQAPALAQEFRSISSEVASISQSQVRFGEAVEAISTAAGSLTSQVEMHGRAAEMSSASFKALETTSNEASRSLQALGSLETSVVEKVSQQMQSLSDVLFRVVSDLGGVASQFDAVGKSQEGFIGASSAASSALQDFASGIFSAQASVTNLAPHLAALGQGLSVSSSQLERLSTVDLSKLDQLNGMVTALSKELQEAARALEESRLAFPSAVSGVQSDLGSLSENLKLEAAALSEASELLSGAMQKIAASLRSSINSVAR
jgi:chromosome segregation ATPase